MSTQRYRGRLAPSPTGHLHLGHARTFLTAQHRAEICGGELILRIEDLDRERCKPEFDHALLEDLRWLGLRWSEGPDVGGPNGPYRQTERLPRFRSAWKLLAERGFVYPCRCSRRDVASAVGAPHVGEQASPRIDPCRPVQPLIWRQEPFAGTNWRFRVPLEEAVRFDDGCQGPQEFLPGRDFGDFIIWRKDDLPAYQLAVVVDDAAMRISEVVRGEDLLPSTAQQLLIYRALDLAPPAFYHCPLVTNADGTRLAKRDGAHSLRALRAAGVTASSLFDP